VSISASTVGPVLSIGRMKEWSALTRRRRREGKHLPEFRRARRHAFLNSGDGAAGGGSEPDRDGDRFLIVEQVTEAEWLRRRAGIRPRFLSWN